MQKNFPPQKVPYDSGGYHELGVQIHTGNRAGGDTRGAPRSQKTAQEPCARRLGLRKLIGGLEANARGVCQGAREGLSKWGDSGRVGWIQVLCVLVF